jgi:hypothetical protein
MDFSVYCNSALEWWFYLVFFIKVPIHYLATNIFSRVYDFFYVMSNKDYYNVVVDDVGILKIM